MFQRKLIVVLGAVALLAMTAGTSQASLSRVEGMGLSTPYTSQFTDDYANIFYYPTSVVRQNNLVLAELGNDPNGNVNSASALDKSYTVIRNFPRFGAIAFQMKQSALNATTASSNLNNEQLDMIWGKAFTNLDFAVRLDITNSYFEFSDNAPSSYSARGEDFSFDPYPFGANFFDNVITSTGVEINTWGISPAIALHLKNDDRIEGVATYRRYTLDRTETPAGGETWKDGGNASYMVAARGILHRGDTHTWYPAAWYVNDDLSWEVTGVTPTARSADETYKNYGAGISDNMRVNDNNLLLWGVVVSQSKHAYDRTDNNDAVASGATKSITQKTTAIPMVFAAIETDATKWLKLRIGASRGHMMYKEEGSDFAAPTNTYTVKERFSDFNMNLGAGIRWNNLDVDMVINDQFPLTGGWALSGNERAPFNRVSATYHF
ncbi:MAG: hypothetical protein ACM3JJ_02690 [Hyphomicrobiales bacterium]